ncbi:MAG: pyridoxamine 5'-phosphate oxidase family protein [Actinomycetota bacterium]|nr:pyridoxamine 5'-phosphate oxidase family protein [Actinomycetota bacterium]
MERALDLAGGTDILSEEDCWTLLGQTGVGRVAVSLNAKTDILPVNYRIVDGAVVFATNLGRKLLALIGQDAVFEVDGFDERTRTGWSVLVRGRAELIGPEEPATTFADLAWAGQKAYGVRLATTSLSGRRLGGRRDP